MGAHLVSEPLRLVLIRSQLLLPLLHVGVGLVQSSHQFGVAVLQGEELRLQIHLTDGAERSSVVTGYAASEMEPGGSWWTFSHRHSRLQQGLREPEELRPWMRASTHPSESIFLMRSFSEDSVMSALWLRNSLSSGPFTHITGGDCRSSARS